MSIITYSFEKDERMGWSTHMIRVNGSTVVSITSETPQKAVDAFVALCEIHEFELASLVREADERREWNIAHPGQGKDWPAFKNLERKRDALLKQAGVKDS